MRNWCWMKTDWTMINFYHGLDIYKTQYKVTQNQLVGAHNHSWVITDFSCDNIDNKLGWWKPKRTGQQFLVSLFWPLFLGTAQAGMAYAQAWAQKNWALRACGLIRLNLLLVSHTTYLSYHNSLGRCVLSTILVCGVLCCYWHSLKFVTRLFHFPMSTSTALWQ
jgi:hypothetical protein